MGNNVWFWKWSWLWYLRWTYHKHYLYNFCRTQEGPDLMRLSRFWYVVSTLVCDLSYTDNLPRTPNIFYRFSPLKLPLGGGGLIRDAPYPPNTPCGGWPKYFLGALWQMDHSDPRESNIIGKLLTSNIISVNLGEPPDPLTPYPPWPL